MEKLSSRRAFIKEFFTLFAPIALGNLFTFGAGFAAHLMTSRLGADASVGIFLSNQVMQLLTFIVTGIEATVTVLGAQSIGADNKDGFRAIAAKASVLVLLVSISLTIICISMPNFVLSLFSPRKSVGSSGSGYLRLLAASFPLYALGRALIASGKCVGKAGIALAAPMTSLALTVAIGLLTINGPFGLGVIGAGISILVARGAELAVILIMLACGKEHKRISPRGIIKALKAPLPEFLRTLAPITLGQAAWGAETMLVTSLMSRFDRGAAATAFGVLSALSNLVYALMSGASSAVGVMISRAVGGGASKGSALEVAVRGERSFICVGAVGAIIVLSLSAPFASIYALSAEDIAILKTLSPILAITFIATAYSASALFGIIKSGGDIKFTLLTDCAALFLITLPISLGVFGSGLGIAELYIATRLVHLFKCPIAYSRVRSGKWVKRLTKPKESGKISV